MGNNFHAASPRVGLVSSHARKSEGNKGQRRDQCCLREPYMYSWSVGKMGNGQGGTSNGEDDTITLCGLFDPAFQPTTWCNSGRLKYEAERNDWVELLILKGLHYLEAGTTIHT